MLLGISGIVETTIYSVIHFQLHFICRWSGPRESANWVPAGGIILYHDSPFQSGLAKEWLDLSQNSSCIESLLLDFLFVSLRILYESDWHSHGMELLPKFKPNLIKKI